MNLPYLVIGLVRRRVPHRVLYTWMNMSGRGNGAELDPDASFAALAARLDRAGLSFVGRRIFEFGSGRTARLALRMIAAGATHVTQVDFDATPLDEATHRHVLEADCQALKLDSRDTISRITVHRGDFLSLPAPLEADTVDLALSNAVLEHVRDPGAVLERCLAWLRPGGVTFHVVDLRDHNLGFRYPLEMLAYSDETWARWFDLDGGFHLNRWRATDYLRALERSGFVRAIARPTRVDPEALRAVESRLAPRFRGMGRDTLEVTGVELYGVRPGRADVDSA